MAGSGGEERGEAMGGRHFHFGNRGKHPSYLNKAKLIDVGVGRRSAEAWVGGQRKGNGREAAPQPLLLPSPPTSSMRCSDAGAPV